jgi:hypothetical protein
MALPKPSAEPVRIEYPRWRHKERRYVVRVEGLQNFRGALGYVTVIRVSRKGYRNAEWPAQTFLETFEPVGRKWRMKNRWDRINLD